MAQQLFETMMSTLLNTSPEIQQMATALSVATVAGIATGTLLKKRCRDDGTPFKDNQEQGRLSSSVKKLKRSSSVSSPLKTPLSSTSLTIVEALMASARDCPDKGLYTFLNDAGDPMASLTHGSLDAAARVLAFHLTTQGVGKGDRVLLCYPPGLDFSIGFWGCLYAGAIAIPTYPPYPGTLAKDVPKFNALVTNSGARLVLTSHAYSLSTQLASVKNFICRASTAWHPDVTWLCTDTLSTPSANALTAFSATLDTMTRSRDDVAFFQYSSGSTSAPKAVMISYGNIAAQCQTWASILPQDILLSWLPPFHDMGLVGFTIVPVVTRSLCFSMSPISFIKHPNVWMTVASRERATHVCAPNFAYALAARKAKSMDVPSLNLRALRQCIVAAEPIRVSALTAFTTTFSPAGFAPDCFNCGYGLAETTLVCTGQPQPVPRLSTRAETETMSASASTLTPTLTASSGPTVLTVVKSVLEKHKTVYVAPRGTLSTDVLSLVSVGVAAPTFIVHVVSTAAIPTICPPDVVGEIWVSGPSVSVGYYNAPELTRTTFGRTLQDSDASTPEDTTCDASFPRCYCATGDLGFYHDGQLYITGRLKDLIIIRGRNIAPADVEKSVEITRVSTAAGQAGINYIRPGCVAAFSIDDAGQERLVVVAEVTSLTLSADTLTTITGAIGRQLLQDHSVAVSSIVLLPPRSIPKTTSGKIQRHRSRECFRTATFPKVLKQVNNTSLGKTSSSTASPMSRTRTRETVVLPEMEMLPVIMTTTVTPSRPASNKVMMVENRIESSSPAPESVTSKSSMTIDSTDDVKTPDAIETFLMGRIQAAALENAEELAQETGTATLAASLMEDLDPTTPWAELGMDSISLVTLSADLGTFLGQGIIVPPQAFFEHTSPRALSGAPGLATGQLVCLGVSGGAGDATSEVDHPVNANGTLDLPRDCYEVEAFPEYVALQSQMGQIHDSGMELPYFQILTDKKRQMVNYNTYNYLGLAQHPAVSAASKAAIDTYGTSMSSSPIVGQTLVNQTLENSLCDFFQADGALLFVGGWVTNVTVIDALLTGPTDLILCDALNHNSCVTGQRLSGATILPFPHNDVTQAEAILAAVRHKYRRVLIVIEGVYSMDGDIPDLPAFVALKTKHRALLFLDEAHSFGTMGSTGRGLCEHYNIPPSQIDLRMGTMSKAMGSTGGFILSSASMITFLRYTCGGHVFSVGLTPANAASCVASLALMTAEPERVAQLQSRSRHFCLEARRLGLEVGVNTHVGAPVVVIHIGSTVLTYQASMALAKLGGVDVKPIVYPAVEEGKCRLRFFLSSLRTERENSDALALLHSVLQEFQAEKVMTMGKTMTSPTSTAIVVDMPLVKTACPTTGSTRSSARIRASRVRH